MQENNYTETEKILNEQNVLLKREQKDVLWNRIQSEVQAAPVPSPYAFTFLYKRSFAAVAFALVIVLGMGGTVYASNEARPGDLLFPLDQTLEEVRLALAVNDVAKAELQLQFAEERIAEMRSLLAEDTKRVATSTTTGEVTVSSRFEAEADVFTDVTVVTVEINDRKTTFETSATTRGAVVDEIINRFSVDRADVDAVLDFEFENRASRVSERVDVEDTDERVHVSLKLLDTLIEGNISTSNRDRIIKEVVTSFENTDRYRIDDERGRVEIRNDDDDSRIEIRDGDSRIRIREKDGEVRVEVKDEDNSRDDDDDRSDDSRNSNSDEKKEHESRDVDDDSSDDNSRDDDDDRSDTDFDNQVRIEVKVEKGMAEVRLEYNGKKDEFKTVYTSKTALTALIAVRSRLSQTIVSNALDLEIKD